MIDFQITEAVALKVAKEEQDAAKQKKMKQWKGDETGLNKLREIAGG